MRERPILFSAPMVRAILDGRKTQTRRVMKPQPAPFVQHTHDVHPQKHPTPYLDAYCNARRTPENPRRMSDRWCWWTRDDRQGDGWYRCPYGQPGDRLWVRETFWAMHDTDCDGVGSTIDCGPCLDIGERFHPGIDYCATPECYDVPDLVAAQTIEQWTADPTPGNWWLAPPNGWDGESDYTDRGVWQFGPWGSMFTKHPSIFMPRWASRITLEVTGVRVERLNDISDDDARAEGVDAWMEHVRATNAPYYHQDAQLGAYPVTAFSRLWDSINTKRAPWASNPWVWCIEFKRIAQEARAA